MLTPGSRRRMGECRGRDTPPGLPFQRQRAPAVPLLGSPQRNHGRGAWVRRRRMVRVRQLRKFYCSCVGKLTDNPARLLPSLIHDRRPGHLTLLLRPRVETPQRVAPFGGVFFAAGAPLPSVSAPGRPQLISAPGGRSVSFPGSWMKGSRRDPTPAESVKTPARSRRAAPRATSSNLGLRKTVPPCVIRAAPR